MLTLSVHLVPACIHACHMASLERSPKPATEEAVAAWGSSPPHLGAAGPVE